MDESFFRWFLKSFTSKTHFMRFLATIIVIPVVIMVMNGQVVPNEMWLTVGAVLGYYYKTHKDD